MPATPRTPSLPLPSLIEGASTTPLRGGAVLLTLQTSIGPARYVVAAVIADELFRITNPPAPARKF